jgi:peptidoglycan/LPS O-acetylase OafA/YrhL
MQGDGHGRVANPNSNLMFLDGLRGLAALYVMVGHARWLLWEGYREGYLLHPEQYSILEKGLMYFLSLFRYGHEAVIFFFVISGFVIHLRYAKKIAVEGDRSKFDWARFVGRRARRLYPPLVAALFITYLVDVLGKSQGFNIYFQTTPYPLINQNIQSDISPITLLGNLAFLMQTYVPFYGTNGPLWSLKFEWWFYMIYPIFWWVNRRSVGLPLGLMVLLFAAATLSGPWPVKLFQEIFSAMLIWWLGAMAADSFVGRLRIPWGGITAPASLIVAALLIPSNRYGFHDLGMGIIFTVMLMFCLTLQDRNIKLTLLNRLKPLGDMSYTLYVMHFPLLVIMSGWLMKRSPDGRLPRGFGWVLTGVAFTLLASFALHFLVERPFLTQTKSRALIGSRFFHSTSNT